MRIQSELRILKWSNLIRFVVYVCEICIPNHLSICLLFHERCNSSPHYSHDWLNLAFPADLQLSPCFYL